MKCSVTLCPRMISGKTNSSFCSTIPSPPKCEKRVEPRLRRSAMSESKWLPPRFPHSLSFFRSAALFFPLFRASPSFSSFPFSIFSSSYSSLLYFFSKRKPSRTLIPFPSSNPCFSHSRQAINPPKKASECFSQFLRHPRR